MISICDTEQRFSDAWWADKINSAISCNAHTASDTLNDADTDGDPRKAIFAAIEKAGLKGKLEEFASFDALSDEDVNGVGILFQSSDDITVTVESYPHATTARAWAASSDDAKNMCTKIMGQFPRIDKPQPRADLVPFAFWHAERSEATCYIKDIQCPTFAEIERNYHTSVRGHVNWISTLEMPDELGKIILWHGPPGMGKTYAIRAFARAWSENLDATVEVILDPEAMLNSVGYLRSVLLSDERPARARRSIKIRKGKPKAADPAPVAPAVIDPMLSILTPVAAPATPVVEEDDEEDDRPLRLIVIEDSAELFNDAARTTPGFGRLLNLTDGIIGQGLRCVFLLTANEELGKIDPAIRRPGRCIQTLQFPTFNRKEGLLWLQENKVEGTIPQDQAEVTLADLYSIQKEKRRPASVTEKEKIGFNVG